MAYLFPFYVLVVAVLAEKPGIGESLFDLAHRKNALKGARGSSTPHRPPFPLLPPPPPAHTPTTRSSLPAMAAMPHGAEVSQHIW